MSDNKLKSKALGGMIWKLAEKVGMQMMQFVIQIILARLLLPEEYGLVGLLTIFITISDVFIQQGFTTALIQRKDIDDVDCSSVFFANIVMAGMIYGVLFIGAPLIAIYYGEKTLTNMMRILSLNVLFGAVGAVHNAILSRELEFKKSFYRSIMNVLTQGVVGIICAYLGMGAWALVFSKISGTLVGTITIYFTVKWKPRLCFSIRRVRQLFNYSSKILITNLLNTIFNNLHSLVIGKYYSKTELGYYQRGQQMPQAIMTAVDGSFSEVLYPTLSALQDNVEDIKNAMRRSMKTSVFIVFPVLLGLVATAETLTLVLLTDKWLPCVPFMQLQCIICMFWPIAARIHALNAIGKSDVTLGLSIMSKVITVILIIICIPHGIYAIMLGTICSSLTTFGITSIYVKKYINYSFKELVYDIAPSFILSIAMMVIVLWTGKCGENIYLKLLIQVVIGVVVYIVGARLFKIESYGYLLGLLKKIIKKVED